MSDDPRRTAKLALIQLHYEQISDELSWNAAKFRRLANALQLTVHELGAFIRLTPSQTEAHLRSDAFPPTVELHLTMVARTVWFHSEKPIFPELPS